MARKAKKMKIELTDEELLAAQRHTDWLIAMALGTNRFGRSYLGHRIHGVKKTKKGRSKRACRGKQDY